MSCGCCLDACPQYTHLEVAQASGETDVAFATRENATYDVNFVGAHAISQTAYYNLNPIGQNNAGERVDALMAPGGIQVCGNAQNCVSVCPKSIPLTTSIGRMGRAATKRMLTKWFDK
jgi:succinate dehydrogenase / fumarate reductase iron-sulfur subunit